jgi:hypothetical protein
MGKTLYLGDTYRSDEDSTYRRFARTDVTGSAQRLISVNRARNAVKQDPKPPVSGREIHHEKCSTFIRRRRSMRLRVPSWAK